MNATLSSLLSIGLFGALGAMGRHGLDSWVRTTLPGNFPSGILAANVLGCLALGLLTGAALGGAVPENWRLPLATGFLGSFTTFSTFSVDTVRLLQGGEWRLAAANVCASLVLGLLAAGAGLALGQRLVG